MPSARLAHQVAKLLIACRSFDLRDERFTRFELVVVGMHTEDNDDPGPRTVPLGQYISLGSANANEAVLPHYFLLYDW